MRLLFDAHQLGRGQTGNETYVRELLRELQMMPSVRIIAAVEAGDDGRVASAALGPQVRLRRVPRNGLGRLAVLSLLSRTIRPDVTHAIYFLPPGIRGPSVVTIHDISFERHPEFFSRSSRFRDRLLIRAAARRATRVITVSETSRRDLIELWHVPEDRVVAIPNGVSHRFGPPPSRDPFEPGSRPLRVLAVGTLQPRKNLARLIEALTLVSHELPVSLRVVGPDGYQAAQIRARLGQAVGADVIGYVSEDELIAEYQRADVFVYPSLYEGFGLPVIEAMASGTPVVTSTGGSLPEIAADAAMIVDPLSISELAGAIRAIALDAELRESLRARGLVRSGRYSWHTAALAHLEVYRSVVGEAGRGAR